MPSSYADVKQRLTEISESVQGDELSLDDALDLYEEAIKLASQVSTAVETDVFANEEQETAGQQAAAAQE